MLKAWKIREGNGNRAGAFQFERLMVKVTRWRVILVGVGVGAYALGLIAMLPAEVVTPDGSDVVGTVWNGEMALEGGFAVAWQAQSLASITNLSLAEGLRVMGPQTELNGQALVRPGRVLIRNMEGLASARLITALTPSMPFVCDADMRVAIAALALKGQPAGAGEFRISPGDCTPVGGGAPSPLPALTGTLSADAQATVLTLTREGSADALARVRVTPTNALTLQVEPAGVGIVPGVSAPLAIETTL